MKREELAWAAGFFDGEGHAGTSFTEGKRAMRLTLTVNQIHREVLDRFQAAVGVGTVRGPYIRKRVTSIRPNEKPYWKYSVSNIQGVRAAVDLLLPYLSSVKKKQCLETISTYDLWRMDFIPSKGIKEFCIRGHDYSNIWLDKEGHRHCMDCHRDYRKERNDKEA
jgi:hypothetical protein